MRYMGYSHSVKLKSGRFTMLNGRAVLIGILCFLLVAFAAFGQEELDPNVITVTEKINVVDLNNNVERLSEAVEKLSENVEKLTESVNSLNIRVGVLEERTQGTAKTVHVILASFIGPLVVGILVTIIVSLIIRNKNSEVRMVSTNTTQVSQSEAATTYTLPPRLPDGTDDIKDYLKSDSPTTKVKI